MKLLGNVSGSASIAAWAIAIAGAAAWQFNKRRDAHRATFDAADAAAWNAKREAEVGADRWKAAGGTATNGTSPSPLPSPSPTTTLK